jgi:transcription termination/antitermination protein NusA
VKKLTLSDTVIIPVEFITSALSPAKLVKPLFMKKPKSARVVVPDYQLSLAIGKEGQNARLAAKLTGWKIDIKVKARCRSLRKRRLKPRKN